MNLARLDTSLLLKSEFRKRSENRYFESFTSVIDDPVFGSVSDVHLKAGSRFDVGVSDSCCIMIPLVGSFNTRLDEKPVEVLAEELLLLPSPMTCSIQNGHLQPVNVLMLSLKAERAISSYGIFPVQLTSYDTLVKTELAESISGYGVYIGVFRSRSTVVFTCRSLTSRLLLYVVDGSFEVEGRLLEFRDTLLLWENSEIELEALAENSIICLIEYAQ